MNKRTTVFNNRKRWRLKFLASLAAVGCALLFLDSASLAFGQTWWDTDWSYRRELTFDNSGQSDTLENFTVLVKLSSSNFDYSHGKSDGADLRFIDEDDSTELKYHIEDWDTSGTSYLWVKVTQIDGSSSTDSIWMYYGNLSASDVQDTSGTYDSSYVGVWHLNETSGTHYDATSNDNDGTAYGGVIQDTVGKIGGADYFGDVMDDYVDFGAAIISGNEVTYGAWINWDTLSPYGEWSYVLDQTDAGDKGYCIYTTSSFTPEQLYCWDGKKDAPSWGSGYEPSTGTWYHVYAVHTGTQVGLFVNGSLVDDWVSTSENVTVVNFCIGGAVPQNDYWFDGLIDEVSISNIARSTDWIKAQYLSMTDNFIAYGGEEEIPNGVPLGRLANAYSVNVFQNHPNPFHGNTTIGFCAPGTRIWEMLEGGNRLTVFGETDLSSVDVSIYDVSGIRIRQLITGRRLPGYYQIVWDAKDDLGQRMPSGSYFCRLSIKSSDGSGRTITKKMVLLK